MRHAKTTPLLAVALALLLASAAVAQLQSGNLYGTVHDSAGEALPGVTVTLTGGGAPQQAFTGDDGEFRFLGLPPGGYAVDASLAGFSSVSYPSVVINVGRNTTIDLTLSAAIEETITVTAESPLLDERKVSTGTTVNATELERVPSARDPWAILQTIPGVKTDRINVGGNESGQQSQYTGPGSSGDDAQWAVDGVTITDMGAIGSSPTYYNFDAFEEVQATTGGSDVTAATGGVTLNMVTKRGTNEWRGSGRFFKADDGLQDSLDFDTAELGRDFDGDGPVSGQGEFSQGNRIVSVEDWGAELGGPIVRDKLWIWANYGKNDIDLLTIDDVSDATELETYGAKVNAQITGSNSLVGFYNYGDKIKIGRNAGPTRPQATTWNQSGPSDIYKLEDTHVFSSSFYLTGLASYVGGGFVLTPQGGIDGPPTTFDGDSWQNNFIHHETDRPQQQAKLDGNYFFDTGDLGHDLKFGVGYRDVGLESTSVWPGNAVLYPHYDSQVKLSRTTVNDAETQYTSLYAQDTLSLGRATVNVGVRYDRQEGEIKTVTAPGVPGFETLPDGTPLLPTATFAGGDQGFEWETITPRLGVTYALGGDRQTLLRASYARFAEQLRQGYTTFSQPLSPGNYSYAYFYNWNDLDGDGFVSPDELPGLADGPAYTNGYDPLAGQLNHVDPGFDAPLTDEVILAVEHALLPEFVVGATATFRNLSDIAEQERLVLDPSGSGAECLQVTADGCLRPHRRSDYVQSATLSSELPDGTPVSIPFYTFRDGLGDTGGFFLTNGDREQDYQGISLFANKRLANRWMLRANVAYEGWEWDVPESEREDPNLYLGGGYDDGGTVVQGSGTGSGSKGGVYISAGWSYSVTGLYQIAPDAPWGFNVSAALNGREGYAVPYYVGRVSGFTAPPWGLTSTNVQATADVDDFQLDDVHLLDLRLEKELSFAQAFDLTLSADVFNVFNESTVLQRQHRLSRGTTDHVQEIVSPRVVRLGLRFGFR